MNTHRPHETRAGSTRNRTDSPAHGSKPIAVRPVPFQNKPLKPRAAKAYTSDWAPSEESSIPLPPDVGRARNSSQGFLLTDVTFKPLYANDCATSILSFPGGGPPGATSVAVAQRIRTILQSERFSRELAAAEFVSGKRLYVCRPSLLESRDRPARPAMVILLLERRARDPLPLSEMCRQFHLSPRERETVRYLSQGLTTKEVAQHMSVSPNTVKQFVRLIMSKMGVTTRSGIVGKLVAS